MYTISLELPNLPKGGGVEVDGLGVFENGYTYDVSEEQAETYRSRHATIETEIDSEGRRTNKLVLGPTLEDAFANNPYITVGKGSAPTNKKKKAEPQPAEGMSSDGPTDTEGSGN